MSYNYNRRNASVKLNNSTRSKVNRELSAKGLDGNGRFRKPGEALATAAQVLRKHDMESNDPFLTLHGSDGRHTAHILLDGEYLNNSLLSITWSRLDSGLYEVVVYMS